MASENTISQPRIDRRFVDDMGRLTEYGYSLLVQIVNRVGGPVGEVLDGRSLSLAISELQQAPLPVDRSSDIDELQSLVWTQPVPERALAANEDPSAELQTLRAEVYALRNIVDGLLQGRQP